MREKSPSLILKIVTSLGFFLVLAPCFWRFGLQSAATLFLPLVIAGLWGKFFKRDFRLSRAEQDWELFYTAFWMLSAGLAIIAFSQFSIGDFGSSFPKRWVIPSLFIALSGSAVFFRFSPEMKSAGAGSKIFAYIFWPILMTLFAFGDLQYLNGAFDFQKPNNYSVSIQSKRISSGKSGRGPLLKVASWRDATQSEEVSVSYSDWCRARIGNTARVSIKPEFLGVKWVEVTRLN